MTACKTEADVEAHFQFLLWLVAAIEKFPRAQKFLLGDWTSPDLVESDLLFPVARAICHLEGRRADITKARMPPARIVEPFDIFSNCLAGLMACRECGPPDEFGLDRRTLQ